MKVIKKKLLDALIQESKDYWNRVPGSSNEKRINLSKRLSAECGVDWLNITDLVNAIVAPDGFVPNAPESVVYGALQALGWEVK